MEQGCACLPSGPAIRRHKFARHLGRTSLPVHSVLGFRYTHRSLKGTPAFERSSNARKKLEMRFAHLKVQHGFERMRLRGLTGARNEFHLVAIVQNLKTMALRLLGPPTDGVCTPIA
ncbi:MAG: transposase [Bradyrhizobium sp.]